MGYNNSGFQMERKDGGNGNKFHGKFRAIVTNNDDSNTATGRMGRLKVSCPKVYGSDESDWCTPCIPFAGPNKGNMFMPKVGETVWIEFEEGNPDLPIWVGSWWGTGERSDPINESYDKSEIGEHHVIKTEKIQLHFNDKDEFLELTVNGVTMKWDGKTDEVTLDCPKDIKITAGSSIDITAPAVAVGGDLTVAGSMTASGLVSGSNI